MSGQLASPDSETLSLSPLSFEHQARSKQRDEGVYFLPGIISCINICSLLKRQVRRHFKGSAGPLLAHCLVRLIIKILGRFLDDCHSMNAQSRERYFFCTCNPSPWTEPWLFILLEGSISSIEEPSSVIQVVYYCLASYKLFNSFLQLVDTSSLC